MSKDRLVIIGGTGFVGRHFLSVISHLPDWDVVYAIHRTEPDWLRDSSVPKVRFDIDDASSLVPFLSSGCTVINLLRPDGSGWFEPAILRLLDACKQACVKRYIHVSSIDVFGAAPGSIVDASTTILPRTPYEREHAAAEKVVRAVDEAVFEVLVLRLGAVFGEGGLNIVSFVKEISGAPLWRLAARRLLYGNRRMHLVSVEKVVETLAFVATVPAITQGEIVLVTDDASSENNFGYLQDTMMQEFGRPSIRYLPHLPFALLGFLLRLRGVSNSNPMRRFKEQRLNEWNQPEAADFRKKLKLYIDYLRSAQ